MNLGEIIQIENNWYQVYRSLKEPKQLPSEMVSELRQLYGCTHTFRSDSKLFLCKEIPAVEFEEILN